MLQTDDLEGRLETLRDEREPYYDELADISFETDKLTVSKAVANITLSNISMAKFDLYQELLFGYCL